MRHLLLTPLLLSSLLIGDELLHTTQKKILDTKSKIEILQAQLKKLESTLIVQKQKTTLVPLAQQSKAKDIKVHTEFGFVSTKGNTDTLNYSLDTKIQKTFEHHELTFFADGEYTSDTNVRTKNKYFLELDYGYKLSEKLYLEYISAYKYDEFSGYEYRAYTGPGLKYKVLEGEKHTLNLSSALLFSSDKTDSDVDSYNYTSYRAKIEYSWQVFSNLKFKETFTYRTDVTRIDDYFIYSKTALTSKLSDVFSVGLNYKVDYINMAEIGKQHADKTLSANLIADF